VKCRNRGETDYVEVASDTAEEVLSLAPSVAGAMIASLRAEGDPLPATMHPMSSFPLITHVAVTA